MKRNHSVWAAGCAGSVLVLAGLVACQGGVPAQAASAAEQGGGLKRLPIHSYNYTDRAISSFYVDGAWGGNVLISRDNAGGGKTTCCVTWYPSMKLPKNYRIRWIADMCKYQVELEGGEVFDRYRALWREQEVSLIKVPPANPEYFEVHFYQDGEIEVEITDEYTRPRLKLPYDSETGGRPGIDPDWPPCSEEQLRAYVE